MFVGISMVPLFTAANCTDCISPVDHIGRHIQKYTARCYQEELQSRPEIWIASSEDQDLEDANWSSAMERRILMAQWLSKAWDDLAQNHSHMITMLSLCGHWVPDCQGWIRRPFDRFPGMEVRYPLSFPFPQLGILYN